MASLVLVVVGDDRAGLVDALSGVIAANGGNWDRSHLTELAGKFAGIVQVTVPDVRADELVAALEPLEADGLLDITVERGRGLGPADEGSVGAEGQPGTTRRVSLSLVGQDRPGIVREVSGVLAQHGVNIADLQTSTVSAPMAGGLLFEATAELDLPDGVDLDQLQGRLEALANELMVDLDWGT